MTTDAGCSRRWNCNESAPVRMYSRWRVGRARLHRLRKDPALLKGPALAVPNGVIISMNCFPRSRSDRGKRDRLAAILTCDQGLERNQGWCIWKPLPSSRRDPKERRPGTEFPGGHIIPGCALTAGAREGLAAVGGGRGRHCGCGGCVQAQAGGVGQMENMAG